MPSPSLQLKRLWMFPLYGLYLAQSDKPNTHPRIGSLHGNHLDLSQRTTEFSRYIISLAVRCQKTGPHQTETILMQYILNILTGCANNNIVYLIYRQSSVIHQHVRNRINVFLGLLEIESSSRPCHSLLNSAPPYYTLDKSELSYPSVLIMSERMSLRTKSLFCRYFVIPRCHILSIFLRSCYQLLQKSSLNNQISVYLERNNAMINKMICNIYMQNVRLLHRQHM